MFHSAVIFYDDISYNKVYQIGEKMAKAGFPNSTCAVPKRYLKDPTKPVFFIAIFGDFDVDVLKKFADNEDMKFEDMDAYWSDEEERRCDFDQTE